MNGEDAPCTRRELQIELKSFRNEVRILIFAALLAAQVLNNTNAGLAVDSAIAGAPLMLASIVAGLHFFRFWR